MTTGALIFAFNNEHTDYVGLAAWSSRRVHRYLNIPVAVITDTPTDSRLKDVDQVIYAESQSGGKRWFEDYQQTVSWHNASRTDAYSLTPWEQTLVLDADYVICSNTLSTVLQAQQDFLAFNQAYDISRPENDFLTTFGRNQFPMWWATVMMFRKSNTAQFIFESMAMIKQNWSHYRNLYSIVEHNYRNDYALSIALGIVNGHTRCVDAIPWRMPSALPDYEITAAREPSADVMRLPDLEKLYRNQEVWTFNYTDRDGKPKRTSLVGMDFHAMGKKHLEAAIATCS